MATTTNRDNLAMTLAVWTGQYNNPSRERDEKEQQFKNIISEAATKDFTLLLTDGTTAQLRLFISTDQDVCFFAKGSRSRGYRLNLDKVDRIEAKQKKEHDKFKTFHRNCEKAASLLAASGLWPRMRKTMEVMAAMTEQEYYDLLAVYKSVWATYDMKELTYDERETLHRERRAKFDSYFTERGAESDFYHFEQLNENKQIVSIPYGKYNQYDRLRVEQALERARQAEGDFEQETARWRGSYDFSVGVAKRDGNLMGWYSAEYKNCGNGHYYLLLDATHAIYSEDD